MLKVCTQFLMFFFTCISYLILNDLSNTGMSDNPSDMGGRDDMDIGGVPYMVTVENLEKGISPFTIMEFIHQQVSITCQASVSPSKSSESYTCGIILLDSKKNLDKLSDFLDSPDHIIISSTGRYILCQIPFLCNCNICKLVYL